jgi:multiple sugar transport system substrate-binding protein
MLKLKIFLYFLLLFLLASCGPSEEQIEELLATPAGEKVTVRWLLTGEGTEPWNRSAVNDFVTRFNKSQDEITIELMTGFGGYGGLGQVMEGENIPDIVGPFSPNFGSRYNDVWTDIESLVLEGSGMSAFDPQTVDAWRRQGKLIGVPFGFWPAVLYYNKDIFDKAGLPYPPHQYGEDYAGGGAWTLDKVAEIGPLMTLDRSGLTARNLGFDPKTANQWGFVIEGDIGAASAIFGTTPILDASGEVKLPESWRDAANWFHSAIWEGMFYPTETELEATRGDPFGKGQAAMFYAPSWYLCCEVDFNFDIAAVPSFAGKATSRREQSGFGIPIASQNQEAALRVIMDLVEDPQLAAAFRIVPAKTSLREDLARTLSSQWAGVDWQVLVDSIDYPDDPPYSQFFPNAEGVYERFNVFVEGLLSNPDFSVDSELDKLEQDLQGLMNQ